MNDLRTPPSAAGQGAVGSRPLYFLRILLPVVVLAAGVTIWELVVRLNDIPPYVLPAPSAVFQTLVSDWPVLSQSLLTTLLTTLEGFAAAAVGGIALALLFNRSKWLEYSLLPMRSSCRSRR
jgi:NitT/TauT family transport system permease protein